MNTFEIEKYLTNDNKCKRYFRGVFSRDQLPQVFEYPSMIVINTEKSDHPGEHWLAIYLTEYKQAEVFDSFGLHPTTYNLVNYIEKISNSWIYNEKQVQSIFSEVCGQYCVFYLYYRCRDFKLNEIVNFFSKNLIENDIFIKDFIYNL